MLPILLLMLENEDDRKLMEQYYEKYRQLLFKVAHDYLDDMQQDEDCVQNALVGVIKAFQTFKSLNEEAQRKYISTICKRCAYRFNEAHKKTTVEPLNECVDQEAIYTYFNGLDDYSRIELIAVINRLNEKYREPMRMKYKDKYSTAEIAEALGITENLVYQRIHRGKEMLFKMLTEVE
ncbi:MAG: sigma-70 family RNA polymerase sigma factor [Clostridia bacterium]|nr:sigma-70 family RNA polymerase sigma factor [Clostridia bacterium]